MTALVLLAAIDRDYAIGRDGDLPWHLPDDLKRFKRLTLGKPLLMGRKTAQSLGRALPGRRNLVLTRSGRAPFEGMQAVDSLEQALALAGGDAPELCVIGGGDVFALTLPQASRMYLTHVDTVVQGADAFFPHFAPEDWKVVAREPHPADAAHAYAFEFVDYVCPDRLHEDDAGVATGAGASQDVFATISNAVRPLEPARGKRCAF